jgi:hypothetical protein
MKIRDDLMEYCTTDSQRQKYKVLVETQSFRGAARILGQTHQSIYDAYRQLLVRQEKGGVYNPATHSTQPIESQQAEVVSKHIKTKSKARYVITSAQNATPVFHAGLNALRLYCKTNNAELIVIPNRYHNPTSAWTHSDERKDWWASEIQHDLVDKRVELNPNLVLLADIRIQPTATRPTSGMETFCGGQSTIIGHPKLETVTIPTPQHHLAKIIHTTGAITVDNYTDSKAGKKGEHHHTFGALVVEIDGNNFFIRQLNLGDDGSFYDLDCLYTQDSVERGIKAAGLVLGDLHERFVDPGVVKATFTSKGSIVNTVSPEAVVFHDVMDFHSQNHHHKHKVFTKIAKHKCDRSSVEDEIDECALFIDQHTREGQRIIFAPSNHPDALARWVEDTDWKYDPENCEFYLKTALAMAVSARMAESGASYIDPFVYWMNIKLKRVDQCEFPVRDQSVMIAGIECGMHGDKGPNGSRGNIRGFGKIGVKSIIGHSHTPGVIDGVYQVGTSSRLRLEYSGGPSSWMHCHCLIYPNGKRTLLWIIDGEWRA